MAKRFIAAAKRGSGKQAGFSAVGGLLVYSETFEIKHPSRVFGLSRDASAHRKVLEFGRNPEMWSNRRNSGESHDKSPRPNKQMHLPLRASLVRLKFFRNAATGL